MLHVSLDKYGFFAVTASLTTLREIIALVEEQNRIWQDNYDEGIQYFRAFKVSQFGLIPPSANIVPPVTTQPIQQRSVRIGGATP